MLMQLTSKAQVEGDAKRGESRAYASETCGADTAAGADVPHGIPHCSPEGHGEVGCDGAPVAQWIEQPVSTRQVGRSSRSGGTKACSTCAVTKPLAEFNRKSAARDGHQAYCRECSSGLYAKHSEKAKARSRRYTQENPEKRRAHRKLEWAIESGKMVRGFCECCGNEKADAHHWRGYDNPLDVQWVCRSCHVTIEPRRGKREAAFADHSTVSRTLLVAALVIIAALAFSTLNAPAAEARTHTTCRTHTLTPRQAIYCLWPRESRATALRVAECESTASAPDRIARARGLGRWARDYATGRHWGVFQLGPKERRDHGPYALGSSARVQVAAAVSLYEARGWQPWVCA